MTRRPRGRTQQRGSKRPQRVLAIGAFAVCLGLGLFVLTRLMPAAPQLPHGEGFNVVLISLDTTRADHIGCYGHPTVKTPHIDRLAAEGVMFTRCAVSAPVTHPSHCSILTGNYPFVHGVHANMSFHLHEKNETLAEVLGAAGYETAGVVGSIVMNREWGLVQGFNQYNDMLYARQPVDPTTGQPKLDRPGAEVVDVALQWLSVHAAEKFFLFVHFYDPHYPYEPPPPFLEMYDDPYAGEIAYMDSQIGRLISELDRLHLRKRTLVVLTGDHGEGLGEHAEDLHGSFLYNTTLAAPLILNCPERIPVGRRVAGLVRTIDIFPTVTAFVGVETPAGLQGVSLLPFLNDDAADPVLTAYSETMSPRLEYGFSHLLSFQSGGWKYIHAPKPELYFLDNDPREERNLLETEPDRAAAMLDQLHSLLATAPTILEGEAVEVELAQRAVEALQSLGYVDTTTGQASLQIKDPLDLMKLEGGDPKDYAQVIRLTTRAAQRIQALDFSAAERDLRELIATEAEGHVDFSWAYANLGLMLAMRKAWEDAIPFYRKALEISPNDGQTMTNLGVALGNTGRIEEAMALYHQALQITPVYRETHINLAVTYRHIGELEEARKHDQIAAKMQPMQPDSRVH